MCHRGARRSRKHRNLLVFKDIVSIQPRVSQVILRAEEWRLEAILNEAACVTCEQGPRSAL